jgi:hypothetical protein
MSELPSIKREISDACNAILRLCTRGFPAFITFLLQPLMARPSRHEQRITDQISMLRELTLAAAPWKTGAFTAGEFQQVCQLAASHSVRVAILW